VTSHPLAGAFSVEGSARVIRHYRYAEERMMRIIGGWIALTPELPAKLVLGRHVWDCAQHADLWGRRLPELRSPAQRSEPPNDAFVRFVDLLESAEGRNETVERLTGVYDVLKPHLLTAYERHLARANPIYEPPTRRILERLVGEERRHVAAGRVVLERLDASGAREAWRRRLGEALTAAGGVTGDGSVPALVVVDTASASPDGDVVALDSAFERTRIEPDLLARADAHCRAVAAGDLPALGADLAVGTRDAVLAEYARLVPGPWEVEIVACAKIGGYRLIKARLTGSADRVVLQQRWRRDGDGWQLIAADVVAIERRR
jgi:hypothetical protein